MSRQNLYRVDVDNNRIEFLDTRFYLHENGNWYPSATTILDAYPKGAAYYEWLKKFGDVADDIRDAAAERGSIVHGLTERYDAGDEVHYIDEIGKPKYSKVEWNQFEKYVEFTREFNPEIIENELSLVSDKLGFGGTLDRIIGLNGKTYLIDIKTSNMLHNHYWLQMAAYAKMYKEIYDKDVDGIAILWLNAKTRTKGKKGDIQGQGWQLVFPDESIDYYWGLFKATQALWNEEFGTMKPRNLSYSLTHKK